MDGGVFRIGSDARPPVAVREAGIIVIGSGMAGLVASLRLAPYAVTLLTKTDELPSGSSAWAQGGIAAALGPGDTPAAHAADTVAAGAGLTDPAMAALLACDGAARLSDWIAAGLPVDRDPHGTLLLGREAAHGGDRILHAGGDATGRTLTGWLADRVRRAAHVDVHTGAFAWRLVTVRGRVMGVLAHHRCRPGPGGGWIFHRGGTVVLATGGIGQLYRHTTNPEEATGDGLALAALAGAALQDLEFVQFHPTALAGAEPGRTPLLTEALRGAGAVLLDGQGRRFMRDEHPDAELAPRDVVARAIGTRIAAGGSVFLDLRDLWAADGAARFPTVAAILAAAGIDPATTPVPVAPAAHYHMGGVRTDADGRTSLPGLYAVGEVACTGVHGANRLASNSLLEAIVFAERAAAAILAAPPPRLPPVPIPDPPPVPPTAPDVRAELTDLSAVATTVLSRGAGLVRSGDGLARAAHDLAALHRRHARLPLVAAAPHGAVRAAGELRNRLLVARLLVQAAAARTESRGAHARTDFPTPDPAWQRHQVLTLADLPPDLAHLPEMAPG